MGFKISWDVPKIISDLRSCAAQVSSPYNDGFTGWSCKQDLLQVKYMLDDMIKDLPRFEGEEEYIRELEKQQVWKTLKK